MKLQRWQPALAAALVFAFVLPAAAGAATQEKQISAHLSNEIIPLTSQATTVGGFLSELSISLPEGAFLDPPADAALKDGMQVFLNELSVTRGDMTINVAPRTEIIEKWHFGPERIELVSPGRSGTEQVSRTVFFMGQTEVGRRERSETVVAMQPRRIVYYRSLDAGLAGPSVEQILEARVKPGGHTPAPQYYRKKLTMESTAYEPGPVSCGRFASGNTSCGLKAGYGIAAVDPDVIPLGTRLYVEGYGYAVAGDVGGAIKDNKIDVCFMTLDECYQWGRRDVTVYILD